MTGLVSESGKVEPASPASAAIREAVHELSDTIYTVASGDIHGVQQNRERFTQQRTTLGKALYKAGVDAETLGRARDVVDGQAKEAGQAGRRAIHRAQQWPARIDRIVGDRDGQAAARTVASTANTARACHTRADRTAQAAPAQDPVTPPARYSSQAQGQGIGR